jgi:hypothetical protein
LNKKGGLFFTIVLVLIILVVLGFVAYKYIYPEFKNGTDLPPDDKYYGFSNFTYLDVSLKLPDGWSQMDVDGVTSANSVAIKINPSSDEDFMYIWRYGYAFDSKTLANDVITYNFQTVEEKEADISGIKFYNKVVSVDESGVTRLYNTYATVKDGVGYVFTLKCNSGAYSVFKDKFVKAIESITFE